MINTKIINCIIPSKTLVIYFLPPNNDKGQELAILIKKIVASVRSRIIVTINDYKIIGLRVIHFATTLDNKEVSTLDGQFLLNA